MERQICKKLPITLRSRKKLVCKVGGILFPHKMSTEKEQSGIVALVGAGPGAPDLITVAGRQWIERAETLVYDNLVDRRLVSLAPEGAEKIFVGKEAGRHTLPQEEIENILVSQAREGKVVVRLKGGDPLVYGRGAEEAVRLRQAGIPFCFVPGITAAVAAGAYAGLPLTRRNTSSAVVFLTGHEDPEKRVPTVDWEYWGSTDATLCLYMAVGQWPRICESLQKGGRSASTPAAAVQWASLGRQKTVRATLSTLAEEMARVDLRAPAMIVIGDVVRGSPELDWFGDLPLRGKRVVLTRNHEQQGHFRERLEALGAEVLEIPLIAVRPKRDQKVWEEVMETFGTYDWLVFSSPNGANFFMKAFLEHFRDLRALGACRLAAVGSATAAVLTGYHLEVDVVPEVATADGLVDAMLEHGDLDSYGVLVVTGNLGGGTLVDRLTGEGRAIVDRLEVYENSPQPIEAMPDRERFCQEGADYMVFTSSSTVHSFTERAADFQRSPTARSPEPVSFGPQTTAALEKYGLKPRLQLTHPGLDELIELLCQDAAQTKGKA